MSHRHRLKKRLANQTRQAQQASQTNAKLSHQLNECRYALDALQERQHQCDAQLDELTQVNAAYVDAFTRMATVLGRECIAAGIVINKVMPTCYAHDALMTTTHERNYRWQLPENHLIYEYTTHMLRLLRAYPVLVDTLRQQVHFRAALGQHGVQYVYAIADAALARMDTQTLADLISSELANLLVRRIKEAAPML